MNSSELGKVSEQTMGTTDSRCVISHILPVPPNTNSFPFLDALTAMMVVDDRCRLLKGNMKNAPVDAANDAMTRNVAIVGADSIASSTNY